MGDADVRQAAGGGEYLVVVEERLAHPHEDEVVDLPEAPEVEHLVEDLRRLQVATEPHLAGRAERARQRTAGL